MSISREKTQTEAEALIKEGPEIKPFAPPVRECPERLGRNRLRKYLFRQRNLVELDAADKAIEEHLYSGCEACAESIIEIKSADPLLRGEKSKAPAVSIKVVRQQSDEAAEQEALAAEVSRKLAAVLAGPAQSFELKHLREMNMKIRIVSNKEQRQSIAREVADACNARWRRVRAGVGIAAQVETAAAELYSRIRIYVPGQGMANEVTMNDLPLTEQMSRNFLLYMMTNLWFLNPQGASTWDGKGESVNLHLPVLKKALEEASPEPTLPR